MSGDKQQRFTVNYHQCLERVIPVEISAKQLAALRGPYSQAQAEARQFVVDSAVAKQEEFPLEFSMATVLDHTDEELFDL